MAQIASDSILADSTGVLGDTLDVVVGHPMVEYSTVEGTTHPAGHSPDLSFGRSWVMAAFLGIVLLVFLRFGSNRRFLGLLAREFFDVRLHRNAFDDTVRETTFLVILNILCVIEMGILLYGLLVWTQPSVASRSLPIDVGLCIGAAMGYSLFMPLARLVWSFMFLGREQAREWRREYWVSQAFLALALIVPDLLVLLRPHWLPVVVILGLSLFGLAKLLLIFKGLRIFIDKISSWVVFLCYLCSLEIVPLIMVYVASVLLCSLIS